MLTTWLALTVFQGDTDGGLPPPLVVRQGLNAACLAMEGPIEEVAKVENATIALKGRSLPIRVYTPEIKGRPGIAVFFHGGGFIGGNLETHDRVCRALCHRSGALVVAVEYRLAPESPFPAALLDAEESVRWIAREGKRFGGDPARLAVVGDSAGGTLSAHVARTFARNGPRLRLQALVNPALDPMRYDAKGYEEYAYFLRAFAPDPKTWRDPRLSFLRAGTPKGLAPATIVAGEKDALLAETREYAAKLKAAKVPVEFWVQPGAGHLGPVFAANAAGAQEPIDRVARALRTVLSPPRR